MYSQGIFCMNISSSASFRHETSSAYGGMSSTHCSLLASCSLGVYQGGTSILHDIESSMRVKMRNCLRALSLATHRNSQGIAAHETVYCIARRFCNVLDMGSNWYKGWQVKTYRDQSMSFIGLNWAYWQIAVAQIQSLMRRAFSKHDT